MGDEEGQQCRGVLQPPVDVVEKRTLLRLQQAVAAQTAVQLVEVHKHLEHGAKVAVLHAFHQQQNLGDAIGTSGAQDLANDLHTAQQSDNIATHTHHHKQRHHHAQKQTVLTENSAKRSRLRRGSSARLLAPERRVRP